MIMPANEPAAGMATWLCWVSIAAAGSVPQAVLDALPIGEPKREIGLRFDPLSRPPESRAGVSPAPARTYKAGKGRRDACPALRFTERAAPN
jgi:hypothetical protein